MWFNKKQRQELQKPVSEECQHKWMDFPAYIVFKADNSMQTYEVRIVEPYVCIHCKKRDNITLECRQGKTSNATGIMDEIVKEFEQYNFVKPKPVVEDMVTDFQKVDRNYLAWYDYLHGKAPKPDITLNI